MIRAFGKDVERAAQQPATLMSENQLEIHASQNRIAIVRVGFDPSHAYTSRTRGPSSAMSTVPLAPENTSGKSATSESKCEEVCPFFGIALRQLTVERPHQPFGGRGIQGFVLDSQFLRRAMRSSTM